MRLVSRSECILALACYFWAHSGHPGLLRKIGPRGVLVIKDVTSIPSMDRNLRAKVLAALREPTTGAGSREVGSGGGAKLGWRTHRGGWSGDNGLGTAQAVVSTMGERFVLLRMDSTTGRRPTGRKAIGNTGDEVQMGGEPCQGCRRGDRRDGAEPITPKPTCCSRRQSGDPGP
jgi:hypothetical protein